MQTNTVTTSGLILSLAHSLPTSTALSRQARTIAKRLAAPHSPALDRRASDLLARLLTAADAGLAWNDDALIDCEFDD
jgi:hypothetical protein